MMPGTLRTANIAMQLRFCCSSQLKNKGSFDMATWSVVSVLVCAEMVVAFNEGKLPIREPLLHEHPTLVALVEQNNVCRSQYGLSKHPVSPYLTELAQAHANWMASTGRFEHNYNHPYPEIIYWNAPSVESAINGWMNSGPHRAIMLGGSTHVGYGYAISASGQKYWCGVFGNMRDEKPAAISATLVSSKMK
jgi:hypothetical protein